MTYLLALTIFMMQWLPFASTESVSSSSSSLQSSFSQYFSPHGACYSYRDVHDFVAQTGKPNYLVARVPVPSILNISKWRELLQDYEDGAVCDFLEFGWPVGFMPTTLPVFDLRTHRSALLFLEEKKNKPVHLACDGLFGRSTRHEQFYIVGEYHVSL